MSSYLKGLNPQQLQAATHIEGPILIVAGAGTGKTRTLTRRVVHLIKNGINPSSVLAITFTNKAAGEMRERIEELMMNEGMLNADDMRNHRPTQFSPWLPFVSTFHSLGVFLLRRHADKLGYPRGFTIFDASDARGAIKGAMKELGIDLKEWDAKQIGGIISKAKNNLSTPDNFRSEITGPASDVAAQVWPRYQKRLRDQKAFDFDDLLIESYRLLANNPDLVAHYNNHWQYVHIDEYQDTNDVQYKMARLLAKHNNICAVGDSDQNIYTWRGANVRNMLDFEEDFPNGTTVYLEQNYRSTPTILKAAQAVIEKNSNRLEKVLRPCDGAATAAKITAYAAQTDYEEAKFVARTCRKLIDEGVNPNEIAILYRMNFLSRIFEESMLSANLPYQVLGTKFFDRKEVKDVVAYIQAATNPDNTAALARTVNYPKRGIGKVSVAKITAGQSEALAGKAAVNYKVYQDILQAIRDFAQKNSVSEVVEFTLKKSGIADDLTNLGAEGLERLANAQELVTHATRYDEMPVPAANEEHNGLEVFLEEAALLGEQDQSNVGDAPKEAIRLLTVHAAKGLEFAHVFMVGMEQNIFPGEREHDPNDKYSDPEEARRLCYVAITRAKEKLYLSFAYIRRLYGQTSYQAPSEFLYDIPNDLIDDTSKPPEDKIKTVYFDM